MAFEQCKIYGERNSGTNFLEKLINENFEIKEIISGFNNYINVVLANLLTIALVGLGIIVFIIPGIFVLCRLAFVPYIVMDRNLGPVEAVQESWTMTKGYGWTIFGMGLLAIPIVIAGFLLMFVGVLFAAMWIMCAFAGLYYAIGLKNETQSGVNVVHNP